MNFGKLKDGTVVIGLSAHSFKCSDGSEIPAQKKEIVDLFSLKKEKKKVSEINGHPVNKMSMVISDDQLEGLKQISKQADIVVVPFPMLVSLREQGVRDQFKNVVAYNATTETQRSAPQDKIVDIDNWSY